MLGRGAGLPRASPVVVVHSTVAPGTPAELEALRPSRRASSTRRSAAVRWARPTARWRSWSAATEAAYAVARAGPGADGLEGRARRPARRRHADEAGPQPDALRRVHRGHRGAAAGRGGRARPGRARARWSGTPTRSPAGRARSCTATPRRRWPRTTSGAASSTTSGRWGRRTSSFAIELADDTGRRRTARAARAREPREGPGPPTEDDTERQVRRPPRAAPARPGEDGGGLRLRHDRRRGRLLPLHRRPPVRRHLEPARPLRPRPPAAADRPAGRHGAARRARDPGPGGATPPASSTTRRCARS